MESLIKNYSECPVCQSPQRTQVTRRPYYDRYMKALSDQIDKSYEELLETFKTYECSDCKSIYSDPWLNAKGMYSLYGKGHAQHILGWEIFYEWVNQSATSNRNLSRARLWRTFEKILGPINKFAQLNCPFFGPLLYFHDLQFPDENKVRRVAKAMSRITSSYLHPFQSDKISNRIGTLFDKRIRFRKVVKDEHNFNNANYISRNEFHDLIIQDTDQSKSNDDLDKPVYNIPECKYLVFESSSCFWSTNCNSLNCSCRAISGELLDTPVIDFKDLKREGIKLDLFCIFNALDHYINPKDLLMNALDVSKVVFFDTHQSDKKRSFSRQHFYVFGKNFLEKIAEPDWNWVDVTKTANLKFQNSFIISREVDLTELLSDSSC